MNQSNNKKKIWLVILIIIVLFSITVGVSIAFFNYTRTGSPNSIAVGNISFNSNYTAVTLNNVFPIDKANILTDTDNVMTVNVAITGNTSYPGGIDYKVTASNVRITTNNKSIPLSVNVTSSDLPNNSVALYSYEDGTILENNSEFAVGHIPPNTNVNGTITLRVYIDGDRVAISDTYDGTESEINGTTNEWVNGRTVLTTSEWNALQTSGIGFSVKVEAEEGVYDSNAVGYLTYSKNQLLGSTPSRQALKGDGTDTITASLNVPNFRGWSTTSDGDVEYKVGDTINFNSDTTLYAIIKELKAHEFLQERKTNQAACTVTAPNKSEFYGEIDADVIYYTGNDESCLKNYVWYSGKLWRIVAIYPNGMMKLVTENNMTSIYYGSTPTFDGSWMDQWLSQEFLPTLYNNTNIVVQDAEWNVKETTANTDPYLERVANDTINKTVGLLNAFEYTKSGTSSGYLHIGQYWWLITPYSSSNVRFVGGGGTLNSYSPGSNAYGARPSIYLKSSATFDTENYDGTRLSPFHIVGDVEKGKTNELLNTRISGEYVKFNNKLYRIVGIENNTTKIVNTSYINNPNSSNTSNTTLGNFGSDAYFNTQSTDMQYWDKYLTDESGWLSTISSGDKNLLVNGTYYLGLYPNNTNYKATICKNTASELETTTINNCMKYDSNDTNKTYTGLVGLLRAGEMMSAQQSTLNHIRNNSNYKAMWLITPYSSSIVRGMISDGRLDSSSPGSSAIGARPSIVIKSGTKITGGSGFINDPYIVG